jgi:hypothetical protein
MNIQKRSCWFWEIKGEEYRSRSDTDVELHFYVESDTIQEAISIALDMHPNIDISKCVRSGRISARIIEEDKP